MGYAAIAVSIVVLGLMLALKIQTSRLESAQETIAAIKIQGELEEARRLKEKERSDADYKNRIARLERDGKRLRDSASRASCQPPQSLLEPVSQGPGPMERYESSLEKLRKSLSTVGK